MSKNYPKVEYFYTHNLWSVTKVRNAVNLWITPEEFEKLTGEKYS